MGKPPDVAEHFRRTDAEVPGVGGIRPKSVFQIGGAGAVGTGTLRGLPLLGRLHRAGFAVWPFDASGWPMVVEIYPRVLTGPVVKSSPAARVAYLDRQRPALAAPLRAAAGASEDAFDAAVSALVMARHASGFAGLRPAGDPETRLEGRIWRPA